MRPLRLTYLVLIAVALSAGALAVVGAIAEPDPVERLAGALGAAPGACPLERLEREGHVCLRVRGRSPAEWEARLASARGVWVVEASRGDEHKRRSTIRIGNHLFEVLAVPGVLVVGAGG